MAAVQRMHTLSAPLSRNRPAIAIIADRMINFGRNVASTQFRCQKIVHHADAAVGCEFSVRDEPDREDERFEVGQNAAHDRVRVADTNGL
jgi:hypothetical protein